MLSPHLQKHLLEIRRPPEFFFVAGARMISGKSKILGGVTFQAHSISVADVGLLTMACDSHDSPRGNHRLEATRVRIFSSLGCSMGPTVPKESPFSCFDLGRHPNPFFQQAYALTRF
jgi:hypothetical protein